MFVELQGDSIFAVVCTDRNSAIGRGNELLYHISDDLKRFKALTLEKTVVMGRATLESLPGGRPLPKRENIVLSRDPSYTVEGAKVLHSVEETIGYLAERDQVAIMGGEQIYRQFLPYLDTVYLTLVEDEAEDADKSFPALTEEDGWEIAEQSAQLEENGIKYRYITYRRFKGNLAKEHIKEAKNDAFAPLIAAAQTLAEDIPQGGQGMLLQSEKGEVYTLLSPKPIDSAAAEELMAKLKEKGDTKIGKLICLWDNGDVDLPSMSFREALLRLDEGNADAAILLCAGARFRGVKLRATMPIGQK